MISFSVFAKRVDFSAVSGPAMPVTTSRIRLIRLRVECVCSTAVERTLHDQNVMGSNPAGCWVFIFFPFLLGMVSLISSISTNGVKVILKEIPTFTSWGKTVFAHCG